MELKRGHCFWCGKPDKNHKFIIFKDVKVYSCDKCPTDNHYMIDVDKLLDSIEGIKKID